MNNNDTISKLVWQEINHLRHNDQSPVTGTLSTTFKEIHMDSLDFVELCMNIEVRLNIALPDNELAKINTVGELTELVIKQIIKCHE